MQKIPVAKVLKPTTNVLKATDILSAVWLSEIKGCSAKDWAIKEDSFAKGNVINPASNAPVNVRKALRRFDFLVDEDSDISDYDLAGRCGSAFF